MPKDWKRFGGCTQNIEQQKIHSAQHDFLIGLPNPMTVRDRTGQVIVAGAEPLQTNGCDRFKLYPPDLNAPSA